MKKVALIVALVLLVIQVMKAENNFKKEKTGDVAKIERIK